MALSAAFVLAAAAPLAKHAAAFHPSHLSLRNFPEIDFFSKPTSALRFPLLNAAASDADDHDTDAATDATSDRVAFACLLADAARRAIMPRFRRPVKVELKAEAGRSPAQSLSPVTAADREAERTMRDLIEDRYPSDGIYGEEYGAVRTNAEYVWVLDPIDGTRSFMGGKPTFGTLIACLRNGAPQIGIIDHPALDERWVGVTGMTTTLNGSNVSVRAGGPSTLSDAVVCATSPDMFRPGEEFDKFKSVRDRCRSALYGCDCYGYALVASGFGADAVVEADLGLYDYCAVVPVVEGAGGMITDWEGRRLTLSNHESSQGRVVACSNGDLHEEMMAILGPP